MAVKFPHGYINVSSTFKTEVRWLISVSYICNKMNLNKYKLPRRDHDFNVIMIWEIYLFYVLEIGL